jgi:seryl-tRNA synthetase
MEQQQNELFAIIGELTYRLRMLEGENEKLKEEVNEKTEKIKDVTEAYNEEFSTVQRLLLENEELKSKLKQFEEEKHAAERAMGFGRPVRQFGHDDSPFNTDESAIFQSLNDAQIDSFYSGNNDADWGKYCTEYEQVSYGAPY